MNPHVERAIENKISARVRSHSLTTRINGGQVIASCGLTRHVTATNSLNLSKQVRPCLLFDIIWKHRKLFDITRARQNANSQTQARFCTLFTALYLITFYLSIIYYLDSRNLRIQTGLRLHLASTEAQVNRARNKQKQTRIVTCCGSKY